MQCKNIDEKIMIERLFSTVEKMINDSVPLMIERYMNANKDKLILDIETMINGRMIDSDDIVNAIQKEIAKKLSV